MNKRHLLISEEITLPADAVTSTFVVYGGKGMGKTNFGSVFAEELAHSGLRFAIIDPMGVWGGLRHSADGNHPGIEVLILGGVHGDMPIDPSAGAVVADLVVDESVNVLIDISRHVNGKMWSIGERIRFVRDYFIRLYARQGESRRPLMQIVDEAARFCPQMVRANEPEVAQCLGAVAVMVEEGRNVGVGVCLLTQRSARLNKDVAELADCMIAFRIVGPRSIDAVLDWFGEHIPKERWKELIEKLRKLPIGRALIVSPGWLEFEGEAQIRRRETFDSSATPKPGETVKSPRGSGAMPDLSKYRQRMAETIERAKADDPRELRRTIGALQAELKKKPEVKVETPPLPPPLDLTPLRDELKCLDGAIASLQTLSRNIKIGIESLGRSQKQYRPRQIVRVTTNGSTPTESSPVYRVEGPRIDTSRHSEDSKVSKCAQRILDVLSQYDEPRSKVQAAMQAGYSPNSGGVYQALADLRHLGWITGQEGALSITDDGRQNAHAVPLPKGEELLNFWERHNSLGACSKKFLRVLYEHNRPMSKTELSDRSGYSPNSGGVYQALADLRKLTLASGPESALEINPVFFE